MDSAAVRAERIALAVIMGDVSMADARDDLRVASRERESAADVANFTACRNGAPVWAWPRVAPWAGF